MALHLGYGRVSTSSGEQLSALDGQLHWLREQGCTPIMHDVESGLIVERTAYSELLRLIESGRHPRRSARPGCPGVGATGAAV